MWRKKIIFVHFKIIAQDIHTMLPIPGIARKNEEMFSLHLFSNAYNLTDVCLSPFSCIVYYLTEPFKTI